MNIVTNLNAQGGGRTLEIKPVKLTDAEIAEATAGFFARFWIWLRALGVFNSHNETARAEAQNRCKHVKSECKTQRKIHRKKARELRAAKNFYVSTPKRADKPFAMDFRQLVTVTLFVFLRFLLLGVTIWLIGGYARASGYSQDVSNNWFLALAFGFPALLFSWVLSCVANAFDRRVAKRRVALLYTILGAVTLLVWIGVTSSMFGPQNFASTGGTGLGLSLSPAAPQAVVAEVPALIATIRLWIDAIFPGVTIGVVLLFTHIFGDVLVSAAAAVWSKLSFSEGRETIWKTSMEYAAKHEEHAKVVEDLRDLEAQLAFLAAVERSFRVGRRATVRDALARYPAMRLAVKARQKMEHHNQIEEYRKAS